MARVTGIGGIFFMSPDPRKLREWYRTHLGIEADDTGSRAFLWRDAADPARTGRTVWAVFSAGSGYFAPGGAPFMINYRVDDLDEMLRLLRRAGVEVDERVEEYPYGRFGWAIDPDGNRIELWEPRGEESP